ncbi:hypothetical protein [Paenibacillus harenae]|uniref:hypothetical protein n=1 Tax=Paenibacillus harenae TaxID=306543 RepID=UPI002790BF54|nr:hypothetical protein [Paenibacillus harenae]MDQ0062341.1 hypothetical protein [Paenibacillus harenae]
METAQFYIMKHLNGTPVNYRYEPAKSIRSAARFNDKDHFDAWINGHYKPKNPEDYVVKLVRATYEEVAEDE